MSILCCFLTPPHPVQILSFNEISHLDGLVGLDRLQHLDLGYNIIEGVQRYRATSQDTDSAGSLVALIDNPITTYKAAAFRPAGHSHGLSVNTSDRPSMPENTTSTFDTDTTGGNEGRAREETYRPLAPAEISLPSLTRLDLNNNILHDLDDLKVGERKGHISSLLSLRCDVIE